MNSSSNLGWQNKHLQHGKDKSFFVFPFTLSLLKNKQQYAFH